jgi:TonB family protein
MFSAILIAVLMVQGLPNIARVSPEEAAKHLADWAKPVYPPIARSLHIQGSATIDLTISEIGSVVTAKPVSGSPILMQAALDAVLKWKYRPFLIEGKPGTVQTLVSVPFAFEEPLDEVKLKKEAEIAQKYYATEDLCRKQVREADWVNAEKTCKQAIGLALQLDPARRLERSGAFQQTGHALFRQRQFAEALENYQKELEFVQQIGGPNGAELAAAQYHVANGLWGSGRRGEAEGFYTKAEATYKKAYQQIESEFLKDEYTKRLKQVLRDHAALLRDMGDTANAAILEKQASALVIKNVPPD